MWSITTREGGRPEGGRNPGGSEPVAAEFEQAKSNRRIFGAEAQVSSGANGECSFFFWHASILLHFASVPSVRYALHRQARTISIHFQ